MGEYKIELKTTIDGEKTELVSYGDVTEEFGSTVVAFEDGEENSLSRIVIGDGIVSVVRDGAIRSVMQFEKGKTLCADVNTDWGSFSFPYTVQRVFSHVGDQGVRLKLEYVGGEGEDATRYEVDMKCEKVAAC